MDLDSGSTPVHQALRMRPAAKSPRNEDNPIRRLRRAPLLWRRVRKQEARKQAAAQAAAGREKAETTSWSALFRDHMATPLGVLAFIASKLRLSRSLK